MVKKKKKKTHFKCTNINNAKERIKQFPEHAKTVVGNIRKYVIR